MKQMNKTMIPAMGRLLCLLLVHLGCAVGAMTAIAGEQAAPSVTFAERQSPAAVSAGAQDMLALTTIAEWDQREFRRPGRWEQLKAVRAAMDAGDWPGALEGFKRAFLAKLRSIDEYGLSVTRFDAFSGGPLSWGWIKPLISDANRADLVTRADALLRGELTVGGKPLAIGEPGAVAWAAATAEVRQRKDWNAWPWHLDTFAPLLAGYIITGEVRYLDRWAAYADDWALNQLAGPGATNVADIPDQWAGGTEAVITLMRYLSAIARMPGGTERFPAATFARVMTRLIVDQVPVTVLYHRANPQNWNDTCAPTLVDLGLALDEFRCGPWLVRDGLRLLELAVPTRHLPDGVDTDSTVGYGFTYLHGAVPLRDRLKMRAYRLADWQVPAWEKRALRENFDLVAWEQRLSEELRSRARFQTAHLTASGQWPIGGARSDHRDRATQTREHIQAAVPDLLNDPDVAAILRRTTGRGGPAPSFTSERFPYAGHAYLRAGWERDDPYMYFFCSPRPTLGCLSWRNNNAIGMSAFGQDLLETGENGTYDQPRSPLRVDGQEQFFHVGIPTWGHRGPLLTAWHEPAPWRWHSSPTFDVAEGVYTGAFGKNKPITGVSHQRLIHAVRAGGLWIVTDRLRSADSHEYALDWRFGILPGKVKTDFLPEHITVAGAEARITTSRPEGSNVTMRHFSSSSLSFSTSEQRTPESRGYRLHDFLTVSGKWKSQGASAVVTAVFPRRSGTSDDLRDVKSLNAPGVVGFSGVTPSGVRVAYQAAVDGVAKMSLGDVTSEAEALLLTVAADGTRSGVVLGGRSLHIAGKAVALPQADAEFSLVGGKWSAIAIHTPLSPITIAPQATTFVTEQTITLTCATAGAEIRYTLDGSDPTLTSPVYRAPFTVTESTVVKARAVRPGLTALPTTLSGTHASVVTRADFTRASFIAAVTPPKTVAGLRYETIAGRWQDLVMRRDRLPVLNRGIADQLFAQASRVDAPTWGVRYHGWIEVPADGVYTLHAPAESYMPNIMAGYELVVRVAGHEWYPATTLHGLGTWSLALRKGAHTFDVIYADLRGDAAMRLNPLGGQPLVWPGVVPDLRLSGPGLQAGAISASMLRCASEP